MIGNDFGGIDFSKLGGGGMDMDMPEGDEAEDEEESDEDMPPLEKVDEDESKDAASSKPADA